MDSLKRTLFEDPFTIYLVLVLVEVVLAGAWYGRRRKVLLMWMLAPALLAGGTWWLERTVVTDREEILAALDEIARAVERGDVVALAEFLDDDYRGWGARKAGAVAMAKAATLKWNVREVTYGPAPQIELHGSDRADSLVRMTVRYTTTGEGLASWPLGWRVEWVRRSGGWKVRRAALTDNPIP